MCVAQVNDVPPLISVQFFVFTGRVFLRKRDTTGWFRKWLLSQLESERESVWRQPPETNIWSGFSLYRMCSASKSTLFDFSFSRHGHTLNIHPRFSPSFSFFFRDYYIAKSWHSDIFMGRQVHWTLPGYSLLESCVWLLHAQDADGVAVGCVFTGSGEKRERTTRGNEPIRWTLATTDCFDKKRPFSGRRRAWM